MALNTHAHARGRAHTHTHTGQGANKYNKTERKTLTRLNKRSHQRKSTREEPFEKIRPKKREEMAIDGCSISGQNSQDKQ